MKDYTEAIKNYISLECEVLGRMDINAINDAINLLVETFNDEGRIFIFGNGGSSATASHFQNDFNKGLSEHMDKKFRFICLNDNISTVMAIANDSSFEDVFVEQLRGRLGKNDIVIAISGSGESKNVIKAVSYAKEKGNKIIGLSGFGGGRLKSLSDISLHVPICSMQISEDIHMILDHLMMSVLYKSMCGINHLKDERN